MKTIDDIIAGRKDEGKEKDIMTPECRVARIRIWRLGLALKYPPQTK